MTNILTDFWVGNERYYVMLNSDTKGYEIYLAKVVQVFREDEKQEGE